MSLFNGIKLINFQLCTWDSSLGGNNCWFQGPKMGIYPMWLLKIRPWCWIQSMRQSLCQQICLETGCFCVSKGQNTDWLFKKRSLWESLFKEAYWRRLSSQWPQSSWWFWISYLMYALKPDSVQDLKDLNQGTFHLDIAGQWKILTLRKWVILELWNPDQQSYTSRVN